MSPVPPSPDPSGRHRQAADIFADALETPPEARSEFLQQACGDDESLLHEVRTLLRAMPEAGHWFDHALDDDEDAGATQVLPQTADPTGRIVSHYRLEEFLGAGGMGEVYRATDVALARDAALKLLRPGVSPEIRERLVQEARTNARFSHPGIAQYFDSGVADGVDFLAMEYVEGETLRSRLRKGAMPTQGALSIAASVLEALVHAHAAGFLHRDIKPENVMLTPRGGAKLLDFGIAKEIGVMETETTQALTAIAPALTMHGMILGTPGYMSPEQLRGDAVDERTDVFSVGVVLYEMLSGEPAFPGANAAEKAHSTLSRELPPVRSDETPADIDVILQRAVARDAVDRYPTASAFLSELRRAATGEAVAILPDTVAILDLENLRGDEEDAWIGSGVAESLGVDLRRAEGLDIVPRDKVVKVRAKLAEKDKANDPVAVGLAVGCRWVLTGSFQRMGPRLRLTMRLVEVATGKDLWTEKLDGQVDDVFDMQDRLAKLTGESLSAVLPEQPSAGAAPALGAYELYTRARDRVLSWDRDAIEQARILLEKALAIDPHYAPALAWMASFHAPGRWVGSGDPHDLQKALDFATRAIEADPEFADGHVFHLYALWRLGRLDEAIAAGRRAAELDPGNFIAWYFMGCCLSERGEWEQAVAMQRRAAAVQETPYVFLNLAGALLELGDVDAAVWAGEKAVKLEVEGAEGWVGSGINLAYVLLRAGRLDEARALCMEALELVEQKYGFMRNSARPLALTVLGDIALEQGDPEAARVAFTQAAEILDQMPIRSVMGFIKIMALAGRTRAGSGPEPYETALALFEAKSEEIPWGGISARCYALFALSRAARALGREEEAHSLFQRAREAGLGVRWD